MMTIIKNISFLTIVASIILFVSCNNKQSQTAGDIFDEANLPAAEKLIMEAVDVQDAERMRALADSLEQTGDISSVAANYYRGGRLSIRTT